MNSAFKVLTLAVDDLGRALDFYRDAIGFETPGIVGEEFDDGAIVFIDLDNGGKLALYPADALGKDAKVEATGNRLAAMSIGHAVPNKGDVDALFARAKTAGATITDPPRDRFWGGYSGYFHDPDGHLWEILWHPEW